MSSLFKRAREHWQRQHAHGFLVSKQKLWR